MTDFKFDHDTTAFSLRNAYSLALAANLAYSNEQKIEETVKNDWGLQDCRFITDNQGDGTECFAMSNDDIIVVAFRGTEPDQIEDWITDLSFDLVDGPFGGKVHEGFNWAVNSVWETVEETIKEYQGSAAKSLWFTGHSLGAALATLATARFRVQGGRVNGLYTFGQPRTGDETFAKNFNNDFKPFDFRFVNNNDVVTRLPPRAMDYSHVGTLKYFTEDGELEDDMSWWGLFLDRMHGRIDDILVWGTDGVKDHSMLNYIDFLKKALDKENG